MNSRIAEDEISQFLAVKDYFFNAFLDYLSKSLHDRRHLSVMNLHNSSNIFFFPAFSPLMCLSILKAGFKDTLAWTDASAQI